MYVLLSAVEFATEMATERDDREHIIRNHFNFTEV